MTKEEAIDILKNPIVRFGRTNGKTVYAEALQTAIKALEEPQWIPCSERLPDKTDDYLCSYNGCAVVDICEYDPDRNEWGFFYDGGWKVVSNVTAWMPLPEPYKEKDNERA